MQDAEEKFEMYSLSDRAISFQTPVLLRGTGKKSFISLGQHSMTTSAL